MAESIHIGKIIKEELHHQGRTVTWLAKQLNVDRKVCYRIFHCNSIDSQMLYRISELLNQNFFMLYSNKFEKKM